MHPWQKPFQTPRAKLLSYSFFDFGLVVHHQCGLWRLKSENFWATFFSRYTLAGSNIKNSIHIRVFERALLAETISDPKGKKTILFFLWFWSLLSTTSMVYEGSRVKTFGSLFLFYRYTLAESNIKNSIHIRVFERATLAETIADPKGKKTILFFLWFWSLLSTASMVYEGSRVKTFGSPFFLQVYIPLRGLISKIPSTYVFLNVHPWQKPFRTPRAKKLS